MKLSLRFFLPLAVVLISISYFVAPLVDSLTLRWFTRDLDMRSRLIYRAIEEPLADLVKIQSRAKIEQMFSKIIQDERLYAVGFCDGGDKLIYRTQTFPSPILCGELASKNGESYVASLVSGPLHVVTHPVSAEGKIFGTLILLHDMSFIEKRSSDTRKYIFILFAIIALVVSGITVVIAHLSWRGWVNGIRALLKGEGPFNPLSELRQSELLPIAKDLKSLIKNLERDRKQRDEQQISWTPKTLKRILNEELSGDEILVVSNREPYIHVKREDKIEVQVPASGLVTALEPIMRACSGTWIAHGSGSADKLTVDEHDRIPVPPSDPSYQIRRVWLSKEEEDGYYYGFSNEGLWPLCHIAHTRPVFRSSDWKTYYEVNQKFADVVCQEAKTKNPVILVQDYHFALLPKMVKDRLPNATIISFWHIPWPNAEAFGICPWREEILSGLLGSSIIGFHTQFHCNNFLEAVDRYLEARIDRENYNISMGGKISMVRDYPISIEWPSRWLDRTKSNLDCRTHIRQINGLPTDRMLGVGVDRLDYTKGILERFMAVERLLEMFPEWQGKFTLIQIAAPTRTSIDEYQNFEAQVRAMAIRINKKFGKDSYQPILLKVEHHEPEQVFEYYRAVDLCMVTSLHDGMNLVAKEFVSAREDEKGVLILSQFTGASRELPEALVVNPYNIDQCATALHVALSMPATEQKDRMKSMRALVQEFNVYRWAGRMLIDASKIRRRDRLAKRTKETESFLKGNSLS